MKVPFTNPSIKTIITRGLALGNTGLFTSSNHLHPDLVPDLVCRRLGRIFSQGAVLGIAHPPDTPCGSDVKMRRHPFQTFFTHEAARGAFLCALVAGSATYFLYVLLLKLSHYRTVALTGA